MAKRKKRSRQQHVNDIKNKIIILLGLIVAVESFLLFQFRKESPSRSSKVVEWPTKKPPAKKQPIKKQPIQGTIAVIIDDSGYSKSDCDYLRSLSSSVTVSILPDLQHSREIASCATMSNKEVMLHLPLEPHQMTDQYPKDYIITTHMGTDKVARMVQRAIKNVPHAVGVNNHMGSKATENKQLMRIVFKELQKNKLFFVDSRVTSKTICKNLAQEMNVPFAERNVFLDNQHNRSYIEQQFTELARVAKDQGYAIGIGHARPLTWSILKEQMERLEKNGFKFVTVKEIIKLTE